MPTNAKNSKRVQIGKDKATIFAIVSIIAVVSIGSLIVGKGFWSQASYYSKVADQKEKAREQLIANKDALSELADSYQQFVKQNPNMIGGDANGTGDRDGDNGALVLDALPSKYDFPALTASLEKLLSGYNIESITGSDEILNQQSLEASGPVEIPFSFGVSANYDTLRALIDALNKSIRPMHVTSLEISGSNTALQAEMSLKTYYQPELGLKIENKVVD
jgi:hypothetical protein